MLEQVSFSIPVAEGADAPSEFRIWKWGQNSTLKGKVVLDKASAASCMEAYAEHGVELAIDYEHQTFAAEHNGKAAPAAGWFKPEVRDDGLWASQVSWTDEASAYLKARQYRYFSPTALVDAKTRKPVRLMPMALTNWPATKNLVPLVAKADDDVAPSTEENHMKTVVIALGLRPDADEAEAYAAANRLHSVERELLSAVGVKSSSEAFGAIKALRDEAEAAKTLRVELAASKAAAAKAEIAALLDGDKRITAAKRIELEQFCEKHGVDGLKSFLSMLPPAAAAAVEPKAVALSATADASGLTPGQLAIIKRTGITVEKFKEHQGVLARFSGAPDEEV